MSINLVIINNFNLVRVPIFPLKTDPPLVIDADRMLSLAIVLERFQMVTGWRKKVFE